MAGLVSYITESFKELKDNVTWPTYAEAQRLAVIVLSFSVIFSLLIWGVDNVFSYIIRKYFDIVG